MFDLGLGSHVLGLGSQVLGIGCQVLGLEGYGLDSMSGYNNKSRIFKTSVL